MKIIDFVLIACIAAAFILAVRHMRKHKGCCSGGSGCCGNCRTCSNHTCGKRKEQGHESSER